MNDLQKCEFDILKTVVDICEKLCLRYYLVCGSALGAVKYQGFIPWDDDIDIALPREDYELFLKESPKRFPTHLFLQNFNTDKYFTQIYSKVRDSRTTYIEKGVKKLPIHHGVYIDVFPLDGYPTDSKQQAKLEKKKMLYKILCESRFEFKRTPKVALITRLLRLTGLSRLSSMSARKYTKMISSFSINDSDVICNHGNWQGRLEYAPKWHYGAGVSANFEGLSVIIPERYDEYLTQKYNDWRSELPPEQQVGHHYYEVCDLDKPYTEYTSVCTK